MLKTITFLGHQISGADVAGFDLIPGSFLLSHRILKSLEKPVKKVLYTTRIFQATAILSGEHQNNELPNSFIMS